MSLLPPGVTVERASSPPSPPGRRGIGTVAPFRASGRNAVAWCAAVALGVLLAQPWVAHRSLALAAAALVPVAVAAVVLVPVERLVVVLLVACQLTGARIALGGFHFFPEHFVIAGLAVALLLRAPGSLVRRPASYEMLLLAWIVWNGATSLAFAPSLRKSLAIVAWLLLAWIILWCVRGWCLEHPDRVEDLLRTGIRVAAILGAATFVLWVAALLGGPHLGVQPEYVTGTLGAKGPALEGNLFGSQELCWLFLLVRSRLLRKAHVPPWQVVGLLLGILSTMTRAVWLAGIVVVLGSLYAARLSGAARGGTPSRSRPLRVLAAAAVALLLVVSFGAPAAQKFQASLDFRSSTGLARLRSWTIAWNDVSTSGSYVAGLGTNSFGQRHESRIVPGTPDYLGNLGLAVVYDTGLVGVVLFGGAMLTLVLSGRSAAARFHNLVFVLALLVVGAATNPVWFGFVWVTIGALDPRPRAVARRQAIPLPA